MICNSLCCVIPENNPTPPQKGWEIPCGTGVSKTEKKKKENKRKQCMKENWNFHRGGGFIEQTPYMGRATHFNCLGLEVEDPQARGGTY